MENREKIRDYILQEILDARYRAITLRDEDSIVKSGLVDSMAIVEIISYIEKCFGINITDSEIRIDDFDSVDSICNLVERSGAAQ
jgi:acyl carrier protein